MVAPARWREIVAWSRAAYRLGERRACRALEVARSSVQYIGRRPPQTALRRRLRGGVSGSLSSGKVTAAVAASTGLYAEDGVMDVGARERMCGAAHVGVSSAVLHGG